VSRRSDKAEAKWPFRLAATLVVLSALAVAVFAAWQFWGIDRLAMQQASSDVNSYFATCSDPSTALPGETIAVIKLPGSDSYWPIRVGFGDASLATGLGWYDHTAAPGQLGNMVVVGYRLVSGGAFDKILSWQTDQTIIVETCQTSYTYTIAVAPAELTLQADESWVFDAVPGKPGLVPSESWLTLIANHNLTADSPERAVGFARLTASAPR